MASRVFAVDLGAWSVKVAVASPGLRGATLLGVYERLLPPAMSESETTEQRARGVLASLIDELRLRDDTGYLGVYGDQVFTQVLEFPFKNLRRTELDKAVGGELEGVVPVDLEDMVYTFEPLPNAPAPVSSDGEVARGRVAPPAEGMRVLTYAMRRDRAEALIDLGRSCGFEPRGVLACAGAAVRLVERTPSLAAARAEGPVAVIDVGHERTDVVVVSNGKAVFSRSIARAGKQVTEVVARTWSHLGWEKAELAKHSDGFIASRLEPAATEAWQKISEHLVEELKPFARDLRQTLAACRAKTGFAPVAALLVGGGGRLRGLGSYLTEELSIPVWRPRADDLTALGGPKLGAAAHTLPLESAAMTIGMAYDSAGGRPQFDLRSGAIAHRMDFTFLRQKAVPLGVALLAIAGFAAGSAYADLYRLRKAEKVLSTRLATESAELFGSAKTADEIIKSNGAPGAANGGSSPLPKMSAYDLLLEISNHTPPKEKITLDISSLQIDDQKVDLQGTTKTSEELDALKAELAKIECFKTVTPGPTDTAPNGVKRFKLTITAPCM